MIKRNNLINYILTFCYSLCLLVVTPILGIFCILSALLGDRKGIVWWRMSHFWTVLAFWLFKITGVCEVMVYGKEKLNNLKSTIIMSNHQSLLDPPLMISLSKKPFRFIC